MQKLQNIYWTFINVLYRNYEEARKALLTALKFMKDPPHILLTDLTMCSMDMRDLKLHAEIRKQMVQLTPEYNPAWICYAMALHLVRKD